MVSGETTEHTRSDENARHVDARAGLSLEELAAGGGVLFGRALASALGEEARQALALVLTGSEVMRAGVAVGLVRAPLPRPVAACNADHCACGAGAFCDAGAP